MQFPTQQLQLLEEALNHLGQGFDLPPFEADPTEDAALREVLLQVAERMRDNYPYFHVQYAGQMLRPPHPVARLAYSLALYVNPNNHALDGGRASSQMEKEAVAEIAAMFGWSQHLGHLTSGGTMANLEALWIASKLRPGKTVLASEQAHYTHERICGVLGIPFQKVNCDRQARLDVGALEERLKQGDVGTVVVTLGTTGLGSLDPLNEVLKLRSQFDFRIHVDTAYGGYFKLASNLTPRGLQTYGLLHQVDSLVVDPHKHGLQPYGCGCVLFADPSVGAFYKHDSPYTYFSSEELHLGEISLECSRAGASAVALWATQRLLPLVEGGAFAHRLEASRSAALDLYQRLQSSPDWTPVMEPELDIVVWYPKGQSAREISQRSRQIFRQAGLHQLHLAVTQIPRSLIGESLQWDQDHLACLRSCLMRPEHAQHMDQLWALLEQSRTQEMALLPEKGTPL